MKILFKKTTTLYGVCGGVMNILAFYARDLFLFKEWLLNFIVTLLLVPLLYVVFMFLTMLSLNNKECTEIGLHHLFVECLKTFFLITILKSAFIHIISADVTENYTVVFIVAIITGVTFSYLITVLYKLII